MEERRSEYPQILASLERLDERTANMEETLNRTHQMIGRLNGDVRALQQWRNIVTGALAVLIFLLSVLLPHAIQGMWKGG